MTEAAIHVSSVNHLDALPADVRALFDVAEARHFECGTAWFANLIDTVFTDGRSVQLYVARRGNLPMAVLPVVQSKTMLTVRCDALSNFYTSLYCPVLAAECVAADVAAILRVICRSHVNVASLRFSPMDPESREYHILLAAMHSAGLAPFEFFCFGNWHLIVDGNWDTYWKSRKGSLRSTVKRMRNKLTADGSRLELVHQPGDVARGMAAYERVYAASWKNEEPYPNFVRGLANTCARNGWLRLGIAWLGDKPIAAQLWIVVGRKANIYKVAYDENYKAYGPGSIMTAMLMEHVISQDNISEVDFLIGDDQYKQLWMNARRERWGLIGYNRYSASGMLGLLREWAGRAVKNWRQKIRRSEQPRIRNGSSKGRSKESLS